MRFYVSTNPQAGDHETEECPECGALIAPGAWMKHRDSHDSARVQSYRRGVLFADLVKTVTEQGEKIAELIRDVEKVAREQEIHSETHGA